MAENTVRRCPTCAMRHDYGTWASIPFCTICRDQVQDFLLVSLVLTITWLFLRYDGWFFLAQEIGFLVLLIFARHKIYPLFRRFKQRIS